MDPRAAGRRGQRAGRFLQPRRRGHDDARGGRRARNSSRASRASCRASRWSSWRRPWTRPRSTASGIVRREVRKLWTQLAYVGAARERCSTTQTSWVEQMRQSARARYASGEGKQLDVLQAGLDAAMLREQQLDLDRDEAMYRSQLSFWLGADEAARAQPDGTVAARRARTARDARGAARRAPGAARLRAPHRCRPHGASTWRANCASPPGCSTSATASARTMPDGMSRPDMLSAMVTVGPAALPRRTARTARSARRGSRAQGLDERHDDHQREMQAMLVEAWNTRAPHGRTRAVLRDGPAAARRPVGHGRAARLALEPRHDRRSRAWRAGSRSKPG